MNKWSRFKFTPNLPLGANGERVTGSKAHIELSKEAAKEGMVLLKNENNVLPLAAGSKVALFGKGTFDYVKGGGGSGDVTVAYIRNLYEGLKLQKEKISIFEELCDYYRNDIKKQYAAGAVPGMTIEPDVPAELLNKAQAYTDTAIISICRYSGEGWDRKSVIDPNNKALWDYEREMTEKSAELFKDGDFCLSVKEKEMIDTVKASFKNVIVILNVGGMVDTSWFAYDNQIQSALLALQGGMEGGLAAAELLVGDGNPSGKTVDTFAKSLDDYPSTYNFHESRDYVDYTDDIYVGYRYFETIPGAAEKVVYPFGYGLSYTTFDVETVSAGVVNSNCTSEANKLYAKVRVTNTGKFSGKEVVQVYIAKPQGKLGKPAKELAAFEKTRELQPGESQLMILTWEINDMASYDDLGKVKKSAYVLEAGSYDIYVGTSVRDVTKADYSYILNHDVITEQLSAKLVPTSLPKRMLADGSYEALPQSEPVDTDYSAIGNIDPSLTEGVAPGQRAIPYFRFADGMAKNGSHDIMDVVEGRITLDEFVSELSIDDLIHLLGGQPNTGVANTGGMGNFSPSPFYTKEVDEFCKKYIYQPTVDAMAAEGRPFTGVIFFGLMLTGEGPKVLEYNARFGDPEAQVVLPRMKNDIIDVMEACVDGKLDTIDLQFEDNAAVCVVLASDGYPVSYEKGFPISGLEKFEGKDDYFCFHAGTAFDKEGRIVTNGGRVLGITATGKDLKEARKKAYEATEWVDFANKYMRHDIGKAIDEA